MIEGYYDFLVSFGVIEHFSDPVYVLHRWQEILKPGGKVFTVIPKLTSLNGMLLRRYDFSDWEKHLVINPSDLDQYHLQAGLSIEKSARLYGQWDHDMLIPWNKIGKQFPLPVIKLFRYVCTICSKAMQYVLKPYDNKWLSPIIYGVYEKSK